MEERRPSPKNPPNGGTPRSPAQPQHPTPESGLTDEQRTRFVLDTFQAADDAGSSSERDPEHEKPGSDASEESKASILKSPFAAPAEQAPHGSPQAQSPGPKPGPTLTDRKPAPTAAPWGSKTQPGDAQPRPALRRGPTLGSGRAPRTPTSKPTSMPTSTATADKPKAKATADRIQLVNNDAIKRGSATLIQVYPQLFDERRRSVTLGALQQHVAAICNGTKAVTIEEVQGLYRRFCIIELIGEGLAFVVPITTAKADAAVQWMRAPFSDCTKEISLKLGQPQTHRPKESLETVRRTEMAKLNQQVGIMVWNIWPEESLLHHKPLLARTIETEVQTVAAKSDSSRKAGIFRESSPATRPVAEVLTACLVPLTRSLLACCQQQLSEAVTRYHLAAAPADSDFASSPGKQTVVLRLADALAQRILGTLADLPKPIGWILRRIQEALARTPLAEDGRHALERGFVAAIFLLGCSNLTSVDIDKLSASDQALRKKAWAIVMSALNAASSGTSSTKESIAAFRGAAERLAGLFAAAFTELLQRVRADHALDED